MAAQSTDLIQYAISPEGTYGTYAAPVASEYFPLSDAGFDEQVEKVQLVASRGDISPMLEQRVSKEMGSGAISVPVGTITSGIIMGAIAGADDASPTGAGPYVHAPTLVNTNSPLSYSIVRVDGQGGQKHFTGARLGSAELSWEMNSDPLFWNTNWMSQGTSAQAGVTPAYADETFFYPDQVSVDIVDSGAAFSTTDYLYESFSLNFDFAMEARGAAGQLSIREVFRGLPFSITGSITTLKVDDAELQEVFANQARAIRINMDNGTDSLVIDLNELTWDAGYSRDTGRSTMETLTRPFTVHNAINNVTMTLTNSQAAYPLT